MEWILIITLIILGITLLVVEVIFIPGTTVVGIVGFAAISYSIYSSYVSFGSTVGTVVLISTSLITGAIMVICFKSGVWRKFSLKSSITSKVNEGKIDDLKLDLQGVAVSALRPIGKAEFNNKEYEVTSLGEYVEAGSFVKIIQLKQNKIYVEPIKA